MGSSPDASIFYGYNFGDLCTDSYEFGGPAWIEACEGDLDEWRTYYASLHGITQVEFPENYPTQDYSVRWRPGVDDEYHELLRHYRATDPLYLAYSAYRDKVNNIANATGMEIERLGYESDGDYVIYVKQSRQSISGWECALLEPLIVQPDWDERLKAFALELDLDPSPEDPAWYWECNYV